MKKRSLLKMVLCERQCDTESGFQWKRIIIYPVSITEISDESPQRLHTIWIGHLENMHSMYLYSFYYVEFTFQEIENSIKKSFR